MGAPTPHPAPARVTPRCCLVVPASDPRKTAKALDATVDEVVLDLEDAVAPSAKVDARAHAVSLLGTFARAGTAATTNPDAARPRPAVRVNQIGSPWCHRDVLDLVAAATSPLTLVVPKVESAADVGFVDRLVTGALAERDATEEGPEVVIDVLVETATALRDLDAILAASERIRAVIIGYADLGADLGRPGDIDSTLWDPTRHDAVTAARATGRSVIDGPWLATAADAAFTQDRRRARALGADGTWVIHPAQVEAATEIFTPSEEEIAWARRVLEALASASATGAGAVALEGQMLDEALAVRARGVLARAGART